jgi:hypothetical protein
MSRRDLMTGFSLPKSKRASETDYALLAQFDTVFLIDDSGSMKGQNWEETLQAVANMSPICTTHDPDGIDIYFLKHRNPKEPQSGAYLNITTPQSVEKIFESVYPHGDTPIGARLKDILEPYLHHLEESLRNARENMDHVSAVRPINIIVITDGKPTDDLENDLVATLVSTATKLDDLKAKPWQIGIQFFQVGDDIEVTEFLHDLDNLLPDRFGARDMVDTVAWDKEPGGLSASTILKVFLGDVEQKYDHEAVRITYHAVQPVQVMEATKRALKVDEPPDTQKSTGKLSYGNLNQAPADEFEHEPAMAALIAENSESDGYEALSMLLNGRGGDIKVTAELVEAVARNKRQGKEMMSLLLAKHKGEIMVTEDIIIAAAGNEQSGQDVLALLLENQGGNDRYSWIRELLNVGYDPWDIADILLEKTRDAPWIYYERSTTRRAAMQPSRHTSQCSHFLRSSGQTASEHDLGIMSTPVQRSSPGPEYIRLIEELCGVAGISPTTRIMTEWIGSAEFENGNEVLSVSYTLFTDKNLATNTRTLQSRIYQALEGVCSAAGLMQSYDFCCDSFTFLKIRSYNREQSITIPVEVTSVSFQLIIGLAEALKSTQQLDLDEYTSNELRQASEAILQFISPELTRGQDRSNVEWYLHLCALAVQFLCLGFLSYMQAHIGPIQPFFLDTPLRRVTLLGLMRKRGFPQLVAELVNLSCLGDMTRGPVLVFHESPDSRQECPPGDLPERQTNEKYDVLGEVGAILDTWGPGYLIYPSDAPSRPVAIKVGDGFVFAKGGGKCHWVQNMQSIPRLSAIDIERPILVGTFITENRRCRLVEAKCRRLPVNMLEYLGTRPASWSEAERQIGIGAGQYFNAALNSTSKLRRGIPVKEIVLEGPNEGLLQYLDDYLGVQISYCTGVARRVPLRILVADTISAFPGGSSLPENVERYLRERTSAGFQDWLINMDEGSKNKVLKMIRMILETLRPSGLDVTQKFFCVAWPFQEDTGRCFKIPLEGQISWTRILADSDDCATFAYITMKCLETDSVKCSRSQGPFHGSIHLLETTVISPTPIVPVVSWTLKNNKAYFFSKLNSMFWVKVEREPLPVRLVALGIVQSVPRDILQRLYSKENSKQSRLRECPKSWSQAETVSIY